MSATAAYSPDPERVAMGKLSRARWKGFSAKGLERLRESAIRNKPWEHSTGPKTAPGKAQVVANGKKRQKGPKSVREIRAELREMHELIQTMKDACSRP